MSALHTFRNLRGVQQTSESWLLRYRKLNADSGYDSTKRILDISISIIAMVILSPLMLVTALLIKLDSKGPVLYSQERIGKEGSSFRFWKFRSMREDSDELQKSLQRHSDSTDLRFKMTGDPRITAVGKIIRKYSIDELPQLWNVLRGDMSLVGPRPALPREVAEYNPYHHRRLAVTPGITCTWQIGGRSDIAFEEQVDMDVAYIRNRSLLEDLKILLMTPYAVIICRGAY